MDNWVDVWICIIDNDLKWPTHLVDAFRIEVGGFFCFLNGSSCIAWLLDGGFFFFYYYYTLHDDFNQLTFFQSEMITCETIAKSLQITFIITLFLLYMKMQLCAFCNTISENIHTHLMKLRDYPLKYCDF